MLQLFAERFGKESRLPMKDFKPNPRLHSLKRQLLIIFAGVAIPALLAALFLLYSASEEGYSRLAQAMQSNLELFTLTLSEQMESAESYMLNLSLNDPAFRRLADRSNQTQAYLDLYQVKQALPAVLLYNDALAGMILCSPPNNLYVGEYGALYGSAEQQLCQKLALESHFMQLTLLQTLNTTDWYQETIGGRVYLLRSVAYHNVHISTAIDLCQVFEDTIQNYGMEGTILVYGSQGELLVGDPACNWRDQIRWSNPRSGRLQVQGTSMMAARAWLQELEIISLQPYDPKGLLAGKLEVFTILATVLVLLSIPFLLFYMNGVVFRPMNILVDTMKRIGEGDLKARPSGTYHNAEFVQVNETFNQMIDQITRLKIDSYERQLEAERSEMAALKFQIRPHFILNCLKNVYALAETGSVEDIQELVLLLGRYLRYILSYKQDTISLQEEVEQCRNYAQLSSIGQPEPVGFFQDIDPALLEMRLPSVSLLTLMENCIKHGRTADRALKIEITGRLLHTETGPVADLCVADNGAGFSAENLRQLNQEPAQGPGGHHVGLYNVIRRLRLQYGDQVAFAATNGREGGARFEVFLPMKREKSEIGAPASPDEAAGNREERE